MKFNPRKVKLSHQSKILHSLIFKYPHGADWLATLRLKTDTIAALHTFAFRHQPTALSRCGKQMMTIYDFYLNVDSTANFNPGLFFLDFVCILSKLQVKFFGNLQVFQSWKSLILAQ